MVTIVLGSQWGDEGTEESRQTFLHDAVALFLEPVATNGFVFAASTGKGKITDLLSQNATLCCRSAGGHSESP